MLRSPMLYLSLYFKRLNELVQTDRKYIQQLGRPASSVLRVHRELLRHPIATTKLITKKNQLTAATINVAFEHLCTLNILAEITGKKRNRIFSYFNYLNILNEGTELPDGY